MTDGGMKIERDGKQWRKGCRIDPETVTIEPGV